MLSAEPGLADLAANFYSSLVPSRKHSNSLETKRRCSLYPSHFSSQSLNFSGPRNRFAQFCGIYSITIKD